MHKSGSSSDRFHRGDHNFQPWTFTHWLLLRFFPRFATCWGCPPKVRAARTLLFLPAFTELELELLCCPPLFSAVCLLQVDEGPCRGEIERYYYNTITQKCELFSYGGCQGNANNFKSFQECQKTCFRIPSKYPESPVRPSPPPGVMTIYLTPKQLFLLIYLHYFMFIFPRPSDYLSPLKVFRLHESARFAA